MILRAMVVLVQTDFLLDIRCRFKEFRHRLSLFNQTGFDPFKNFESHGILRVHFPFRPQFRSIRS